MSPLNLRSLHPPSAPLLVLVAALPVSGTHAQSDPLFPGLQIDVGGLRNMAGALADLDGDGELDHATAVWGSDVVALSRGLGNGTFAAAEHVTAGSTPVDVEALDVDGDGDLDLLVACSAQPTGASTLVVLRNDGAGAFAPPEATPISGFGGWSMAVADADLDGDADVFVAASDGVRMLLGDGAGSFAAGVAIDMPPGVLVVDDVDGDHDPDLIVAAVGIVVRRNDGTAAFGPAETTPLPYLPASLATADVDGDGDRDLISSTHVAAPPVDTLLGVIFNDGTGAYTAAPLQSVGVEEAFDDVRGVDLDGDGFLDLVVTVEVDGVPGGDGRAGLAVLRGDGTGAFTGTVHPFTGFGTGFQDALRGLSLGDLDRDGVLDAVVVSDEALVLFPGDGAGGFRTASEAPAIVGARRVACADLDGDGYLDLLSASSGAFLALALGDGDGGFGAEQVYLVSQFGPRIMAVDWDGDLDLDVLSVGGQGLVDLLSGDGSGALALTSSVDAGVLVLDAVRGDFDADGFVDLMLLHAAGGVLVSSGPGGFGAPASVDLCPGEPCAAPRGLDAGDVDSDGVLDLVVARSGAGFEPSRVDSFVGLGGGAFAFAAATELFAFDVELGDLDEDGSLDLVAQASPLSVRKGDGLGGFAPWYEFPTAGLGTSTDAMLVDIDADGDLDLVRGGGDVRRGDGAGGLGPLESHAWPHNWLGKDSPPVVADLDADGRPDVVTLDLVNDQAFVSLALGGCGGEIAAYGASCPGSGGFAPELVLTGCASPGGTLRATIQGGLGGAPAILLLGTGAVDLPLPNGCALYAAPIVATPSFQLSGAVAGAGELELSAVLGAAPPGAVATLQALILDAAAPAWFTSTNGVRVVLGR